MTMNKKAYRIPNSIQERTIHLTDDISTLITAALRNDSTTKNNNIERRKMYLIEPIRNGEYITDGAIALAMQVYVNQNIFR